MIEDAPQFQISIQIKEKSMVKHEDECDSMYT